MLKTWLLWISDRPIDGFVLVSILGAISFAFGGENVGTAVVFGLIGLLVLSISLGRRMASKQPPHQPGVHKCGACRQLFQESDLRMLAKFVAVLGPATWAARQRIYCLRCARRQEMFVVGIGIIILALAVGTIGSR